MNLIDIISLLVAVIFGAVEPSAKDAVESSGEESIEYSAKNVIESSGEESIEYSANDVLDIPLLPPSIYLPFSPPIAPPKVTETNFKMKSYE